jgi:hypothetical protein
MWKLTGKFSEVNGLESQLDIFVLRLVLTSPSDIKVATGEMIGSTLQKQT